MTMDDVAEGHAQMVEQGKFEHFGGTLLINFDASRRADYAAEFRVESGGGCKNYGSALVLSSHQYSLLTRGGGALQHALDDAKRLLGALLCLVSRERLA